MKHGIGMRHGIGIRTGYETIILLCGAIHIPNFNNDIMIIHANLVDNLEYCRVQDLQECFWKLVL